MNLLNFIDLSLRMSPSGMSDSSLEKVALCRAVLEDYHKKNGCDLCQSISSEFLYRFGMYLATENEKRYSPSTIREILRTIRKYIRMAIHEGLVPNIDAVPSVIQRLDSEVWPDAVPERRKKPTATLRPDLGVKASVNTVMRSLDIWSTRQKAGMGTGLADRQERTEALQNRCAAVYLFCVLTYGLEIKDALAIKRDWEGQDVPDSVFVERYGMRLTLSPTAKRLVRLYNQDSVCTGHLFFTLDNKKYKDDLDNATKLIEGHAIKYLMRNSIPLYRKKNVFIDWLNYAIECGIPDSEAEMLWMHHLGQKTQSSHMTGVESAQSKLSRSESRLEESWYLMCIIPFSIKREAFVKMLMSSGILGEEPEAMKRIYAPEERMRDKERGAGAVFSRYVFFRGTQAQAEFANGFSQYAYVFKDRAKKRFARICQREIECLQVMLRDFPDAVELVDGQRWLEEHNAKIVEGCKAVIRSGALIGKEATVVQIKGRKSGRPTFIIEYVEGAIKFHTSLEGAQIDIIQE